MIVKCVEKIRNNSNQIIEYILEDCNGEQRNFEPDYLKTLIKNGQIEVSNLKLTTDDRLIDYNYCTHDPFIKLVENKGVVEEEKYKQVRQCHTLVKYIRQGCKNIFKVNKIDNDIIAGEIIIDPKSILNHHKNIPNRVEIGVSSIENCLYHLNTSDAISIKFNMKEKRNSTDGILNRNTTLQDFRCEVLLRIPSTGSWYGELDLENTINNCMDKMEILAYEFRKQYEGRLSNNRILDITHRALAATFLYVLVYLATENQNDLMMLFNQVIDNLDYKNADSCIEFQELTNKIFTLDELVNKKLAPSAFDTNTVYKKHYDKAVKPKTYYGTSIYNMFKR